MIKAIKNMPFWPQRVEEPVKICMMSKKSYSLVYSSEHGKICSGCLRQTKECRCLKHQKDPVSDGIVRLSRQTKGRKGKGVTIITGLALGNRNLQSLARELKQKCGCGGTVKEGIIEIQGDHRDVLVRELSEKGYRVKKSGG
jgi:translation initiation factor 1